MSEQERKRIEGVFANFLKGYGDWVGGEIDPIKLLDELRKQILGEGYWPEQDEKEKKSVGYLKDHPDWKPGDEKKVVRFCSAPVRLVVEMKDEIDNKKGKD